MRLRNQNWYVPGKERKCVFCHFECQLGSATGNKCVNARWPVVESSRVRANQTTVHFSSLQESFIVDQFVRDSRHQFNILRLLLKERLQVFESNFGWFGNQVILILFLVQGAAGCANVSTESVETSSAAKNFDPLEDKGIVFLYRRGRMVGAASATLIKVNGIDAGGTGPGTFFRWELKPGPYTFLASTSESSATVALDVEAGGVYFLEQTERIGLNGGRVTMNVRDAKLANPRFSR